MRKKMLIVPVLMLLILFGTALPVFAIGWIDPKTVQNPYHDGREYTRQHWTRFWVNETGFHKNYGEDSEVIGQGYCSVFDLPGSLAEGYTAVMNSDTDVRLYNVRPKFLEAFAFDFDNDTQGYPCSPAWYKKYGDGASYISDKSGCQYDVPIKKTKGDSYTKGFEVPKEATIKNPACLKKGDPADVAGGHYDGKKWYWYAKKGDAYGEINLTKSAATTLYWDPSGRSTSADIIVSFPYGLTMTGMENTYLDPNNKEDSFIAYIQNTTPYKAVNVKFRAYELLSDGKMVLIDEKVDEVPAMNKTTGFGIAQYTFKAPVQQSDYKVIATVNINAAGGLGSGSICEPLITQYAYGSLAGNYVHGPGGVLEKALHVDWPGRSMPNKNYNDNYQLTDRVGHMPAPKPPGPEPPKDIDNLSVYDLHVYDKANGQDVTSPTISQALGIRASYKSTFSVGGWARLRFYRYEADYTKLTQIGDTVNYYFGPGADMTYDYGKDYAFNLGTGKYKIIASIDYYNNGNNPENNWQSEKFDGTHDESTYDDNKMVRDLTGSEAPYVPPTPMESSNSGWFPPVAIIEIPGEPKEELQPVYGWRRVPLIKDGREAEKKVRLVE